jgi:hypothetical protein
MWKCYAVEYVECNPTIPDPERPGVSYGSMYRLSEGEVVPFRKLRVGAMWRHPQKGIAVKLPGYGSGVIWYMEMPGTDGCRWAVTGEMPNVTAQPSINFVGTYHGFVQNGQVTDDVDGKRFDDYGKQL